VDLLSDEEGPSDRFFLLFIDNKMKMMVRTIEMPKKIQSSIGIKDLSWHFFNNDTASSITDWDFNGSILRNGNE